MNNDSASVFLKEVQGRTWYRADHTRASAEAHLSALPAGAFVVRPSSQPNCVALSFVQEDGTVGHNQIVMVHDASRVPATAFRLANATELHSSVKALLKSMASLRFDRSEQQQQRPEDTPVPPSTTTEDVLVAPPRRESNLVRANLTAARQAVVESQVRKLLALMPARASERLKAQLVAFDELDLVGATRAQLDELMRSTRGKVLVKLFFDVVAPGAPFITLSINKTATARQVCLLACAKRLFPALHRACQLAIVSDGTNVTPMADLDRPASLSLVWASKQLPPTARAFVLRLKPLFDPPAPAAAPVIEQPRLPWRAAPKLDPGLRKSSSSSQTDSVYGFVPRALPPASASAETEDLAEMESAFTTMAADLELGSVLDEHDEQQQEQEGEAITEANAGFFFDLPPTTGEFGVEVENLLDVDEFQSLLADFDAVAKGLDDAMQKRY